MIKYIILGIIQGLTEFLPVSSSGHLVLMQKLLAINTGELAISVVLHLGTAFALLVFFFKDIIKVLRDFRMLLFIAVVTVITGSIGLLGKDFFEGLFASTTQVGIALIITGLVLIATKKISGAKRDILDIKDAVVLGFTQAIAIIPGISRSGITISTLLFRKVDREMSFKFSFLVALPVIFAAAFLELKEINFALKANPVEIGTGFLFSFISGLLALRLLKVVLTKAKFHYFGYYCILVAVITLLFLK